MKTATGIGYGGTARGEPGRFDDVVAYVVEAERLGVDSLWSAEAWGSDAVSPLAFVAAHTRRVRLGTGLMQISARVPSMTAMTALTMAEITGNRFCLGLGASGPQVVEGLHGQPFAKPLERLRETIEIVRMAFRGERIAYAGKHHILPRPGGEGKALRLWIGPNDTIPIYVGTLTPKTLELTGELADGWLGTSFLPEGADVVLPHIQAGAEKAGRSLAEIDLQVGGTVAFGEDIPSLVAPLKRSMAFSLGAMGSARTNFYNAAYARAGFQDVAKRVQALWVEGRRDDAVAEVPDEMILKVHFVGTDDMVRERMRAYRDVGITTLRLEPRGKTLAERVDTLSRAVDLVRQVNEEPR